MRAFRSDPAVKAKYLARVRAHAAADEIVQGVYWQNGRGCAIGCMSHGRKHVALANSIGCHVTILWLVDRIFERMPNAKAKQFPLELIAAAPVASDRAEDPAR